MADYTITSYKLENILVNLGEPFGFTPFIICRILDDWQDTIVSGDRVWFTADCKRALYNYGKTHTTVYAISGRTVDFEASSFGYHSYPIKSSNDIVKMNVFMPTDHGLSQYMLFANESYSKEVGSNNLAGRARPWWLIVDKNYFFFDIGQDFNFTVDLTQYYAFDTFDHFVDNNGLPYGIGEGYVPFSDGYFANTRHIFYRRLTLGEIKGAEVDPYNTGGNTTPSPIPPTGDFDNTSDPVTIPPLPTLSAVDARFITLYAPTLTDVQDLASYMWSDLFNINNFKRLFADPMQAILGLSILPIIPDQEVVPSYIHVGNLATTITAPKITNQYKTVNCGSINVNEYWGSYLDYDPYTKLEIYLPYIGTQTIAVDDVMGKEVQVVYNIDVLSGACVAFIKSGDSVLYTFTGQCATQIPITSNDWTNTINGVLSFASSAIKTGVAIASGEPVSSITGAISTASAVTQMKPRIQRSGSIGGSAGLMSIQTPYFILTRPRQALPTDQNKYTGYPSFITSKLGDLSGMTYVYEIHLEGIPCTTEEQTEIENLLKSGVIL